MFRVVLCINVLILFCVTAIAKVAEERTVSTESVYGSTPLTSGAIQEQTFQPDGTVGKDASLYSWTPSVNYGNALDLIVMWIWNPSFDMHSSALIAFTELDDSQFQGATVISADLLLYKYMGSGGPFRISRCVSSWDESTVTWNNMPSSSGYQLAGCPGTVGWVSFDVTDFVQNWLDGTDENYGICLSDNYTDYTHSTFRSSDYDSIPALRPKLVLSYIPFTAVERNTWAQIKTFL